MKVLIILALVLALLVSCVLAGLLIQHSLPSCVEYEEFCTTDRGYWMYNPALKMMTYQPLYVEVECSEEGSTLEKRCVARR